jgi:protein-S-isoprenylcysteine O-methyltransferase Ste14
VLRWIRNQWDRSSAAAAFVAGVIALLLGWLGSSGTVYPAQQIPFLISGGLVGVVLVAFGAAMWVSADLRDEWRKLDEIHETLVTTEATAEVPSEVTAIRSARLAETAVR